MIGGPTVRRRSSGFTIVEVLIVLAVTSALFVVIALTISGKQGKEEFRYGVTDAQSAFQHVINEVKTGYYPSQGDFTCIENPSGSVDIRTDIGSTPQGQNTACVFMGKVISPLVLGATDQYNVFSIAGLRKGTGLDDSDPSVIAGGSVDTTETRNYKYGLTVKSIKYNNGAGDLGASAVGFMSNMGPRDATGALINGTQAINLVVLTRNSGVAQSKGSMQSQIDNDLKQSIYRAVNPSGGVKICMQGGNNQTALITIGSNGHDLLVKSEVKSC